jgi:hypothetical protein
MAKGRILRRFAGLVLGAFIVVPGAAQADPCAEGGGGWGEALRLMAEAIPTEREAGRLTDARLAEAQAGVRAALAADLASPDEAALCRAVEALRQDYAPAPGPSVPADGRPGMIAAARCDRDDTAEMIGVDMMTDMKPPEAGGPLDEAAYRDFSVTYVTLEARIMKIETIPMRSVCLSYLGLWLLFRV